MSTTIMPETILSPITRLRKDLKSAVTKLNKDEARYLVDFYYMIQGVRIGANNQMTSLVKSEESHEVIEWLAKNAESWETDIKKVLDIWTDQHPVGVWSKSIYGIGPVLSAGLLAHIDINKAPTVGRIWRFAGLDPTSKWNKGEKRPWNAKLKVLCWKIGQSFLKFHNQEECYYGHVYKERKELEIKRNDEGLFKPQAEASLDTKSFKRDTEAKKAYEQGKLPPGRLDLRAQRYAVKLFLSHWHWVCFESTFGTLPPKPYVIEHLGHAELLKPPNWK